MNKQISISLKAVLAVLVALMFVAASLLFVGCDKDNESKSGSGGDTPQLDTDKTPSGDAGADAGTGVQSGLTYTKDGTTSVTITGYTGTSSTVVIPATIDNIPVTRVNAGVFSKANQNVTSVTIPASVTYIGANAFDHNKITSLDFKDKNNWKAYEYPEHLQTTGSGQIQISVNSDNIKDGATAANYYKNTTYKRYDYAWFK